MVRSAAIPSSEHRGGNRIIGTRSRARRPSRRGPEAATIDLIDLAATDNDDDAPPPAASSASGAVVTDAATAGSSSSPSFADRPFHGVSSSSSATAAASAGASPSASATRGPAANGNADNVLRFHRPRRRQRSAARSEEEEEEEECRIFPPTIFTDAIYSRGILVPNPDYALRSSDDSLREGGADGEDDDERQGEHFADSDAKQPQQQQHQNDGTEDEEIMKGENNDNDHDNGSNVQVQEVEIPLPYDYFAPDNQNLKCRDKPYNYQGCVSTAPGAARRRLPILSENEAALWLHKNAAHAAAKRRFPMEVARLLGTITLYFDEAPPDRNNQKGSSRGADRTLDKAGLFALVQEYDDHHSRNVPTSGIPRCPLTEHDKFSRGVSKKQAMVEAMAEQNLEGDPSCPWPPWDRREELTERAEEIVQSWNEVKKSAPLRECWNPKDGGFLREALGSSDDDDNIAGEGGMVDERHVPVACLLSWLVGETPTWRKKTKKQPHKRTKVTDRAEGRTASLYGGLRRVPTDAKSILASLLDLGHPSDLYKMPFVTSYAVARAVRDEEKTKRNVRTWKVRIGVYMNRLLPEILTSTTLHTIMSALDDDSYIVSEPLHMPPLRDAGDPVFRSSKYPIIRMPGMDYSDLAIAIDDDDMAEEGAEEEKKEEEDGTQLMDAARIGSSRDSTTISPFTPRGLLKLMENVGNDVSMWPQIEERLRPYLKLDLMLHQQHAICWMTQMEHLEGFGINSILWEERQFLDGGKYYYSPALGQIRLGRPPVTVGGCCADEMGLGKTLQMLSLVASSLTELKQEARKGDTSHTHCTLIIVPPALAAQWKNEVEKSCGNTLKVSMLDARSRDIDPGLVNTNGNGSDILITTYGALEKTHTINYLARHTWGRIVLDEQQEIRSSTTKIAQNCEKLDCHRRWMLSGTPIFEGIDDLRGELNFLRLEPYAAKLEDGFFDFSIMNHWKTHSQHGLDTLRILGLLILRRSKDMSVCRTGAPIMEQKKLTVEYAPVAQRASERALYCFIEYIVSKELQRHNLNERDLKSRALCLRLLKQMCFSVVLMNGGLGVSSQLKTLNSLMVRINRQSESEHSSISTTNEDRSKKRRELRKMNCDEARTFLSQVQTEANVSEDFVTDQVVGQGGGANNRDHAMDSAEDQIKEAEKELALATKKQRDARRKRAKSNWHLALELVTSGSLEIDEYTLLGVSSKFSSLWKWRFLCNKLKATSKGSGGSSLPQLLERGWRPHESFVKDVRRFDWAHPYALFLDNLPPQLTLEETQIALLEAVKKQIGKKQERLGLKLSTSSKRLEATKDENEKKRIRSDIAKAEENLKETNAYYEQLQLPMVMKIADPNSSLSTTCAWRAYAQVQDEDFYNHLIRAAESTSGFAVQSNDAIPHVEEALKAAKGAYEYAESQSKVYPCVANKKLETAARKALERAKLGLRMLYGDTTTMNVVMSRALAPLRGHAPRTSAALFESAYNIISQEADTLERVAARIESHSSTISRLKHAIGRNVSQEVSKMSAFDVLEALKDGDFDKTNCPICLGPFGGPLRATAASDEPIVAMTSCGHFYCISCLDEHIHRNIRGNGTIQCPNCRRGVSPSSDIIHIEHFQSDEEEQRELRNKAKEKVREVSQMLEASGGVISGDLWHSLFLSIDVPSHVSQRGHRVHTALPRDFLAHLRSSTGMAIDCSRNDMPPSVHGRQDCKDVALSSKVQALLGDLPLGEHAVVFSSSKEGVLHLAAVMKAREIDCFSLFVGQKAATTQESVSGWQNVSVDPSRAGPVLVVQAGAAASGLTLTAASKMFLMEPFSRQEEEQQAYARCHRFGQKNNVHVKVYYAPVSVESRLLCWRNRAAARMTDASPSADYVFKELDFEKDKEDNDITSEDDVDDMMENDEDANKGDDDNGEEGLSVEDNKRTQFLLGLIDEHGNPIGVEGKDSDGGGDDDDNRDDNRKIAARRFILD